MLIGVPKECAEGERRLALVREVVRRLLGGDGLVVVVERGAGTLIPDSHYEEAGARLVDDPTAVYESDLMIKVASPGSDEIGRLRSDSVLIGA